MAVEAMLVAPNWTDITADTVAPDGMTIRYGIGGGGPTDVMAATGECQLTLANWANGSRLQGAYSPLNANVRTGWTFKVPLRVIFTDGADSVLSVTSLVHSTGTDVATATTSVAHGLVNLQWVRISGATPSNYNGVFMAFVLSPTQFFYQIVGDPASPATGTITCQRVYVKHRGTVRSIDPLPGKFRSKKVAVVSYDAVRDLAETPVRTLSIQTNNGERELILAVLAVTPATSITAFVLDSSVDTLAYAFHDIGDSPMALQLLNDISLDSACLTFVTGAGVFQMINRHTRAAFTPSFALNDTMHDFEAPTNEDQIYDIVRMTIHPPKLDTIPSTILYSDQAVRSIAANSTVEFFVSYFAPNQTDQLIGALDVVVPLVSGTDYIGNDNVSGLGVAMTASLVVTVTAFGSTAKVNIQNTAPVPVYLVDPAGLPRLQIRGRGVYDIGPQTFSAPPSPAGTKELAIGLRYQSSGNLAQNYAEFLYGQRSSVRQIPGSVTFIATGDSSLMTQALAREPGDVITLTETMTGLTAIQASIQSVELEIGQGQTIVCKWVLAPSTLLRAWLWGLAGFSEWGMTTYYGF